MAYTDRGTTRRGSGPRGILRREMPGTVGLLADARDFAQMVRYRTFGFDDHAVYLRHVEALLRTLGSRGTHTSVALFDPARFADFCARTGLEPDSPASRSRFTADIAARGATIAYAGQPLDSLITQLVDETARQATWEYTTTVLAGLGDCADCGKDVGRAAFDRAARLVHLLLETAGPGTHHLVCSVPAASDQLLAVLHAECEPHGPVRVDDAEAAEFATVLATGIALESPGGLVLRTSAPGAPDRLRGWRLSRGRLAPLTTAEVFSAYCTDAETGDPVAPEPGVEYCAGFEVDDPGGHDH
ncbi:hypothetical protein [Streptomyces sp. GC420]|uniref:hypothetical protein n=1 Tax=Streptomyces sp. GC420 TaxID=2697568 RepID=UPI001414DC2D|nr:hypothetical protein [Streptomyces sp. GC420]NBM19722.1 hypothetical protein [Streptomyces sp. GC420]